MDCMVDLPELNECSFIWLVVDHFIEMSHFSPLKDVEKTAPDLASIFRKR